MIAFIKAFLIAYLIGILFVIGVQVSFNLLAFSFQLFKNALKRDRLE